MTYKYQKVRRDIFELKDLHKIDRLHSCKDYFKLYKLKMWIRFTLYSIIGVASIVIVILCLLSTISSTLGLLLSNFLLVIVIILIIVFESSTEKNKYNKSARDTELRALQTRANNYVEDVKKVLSYNGITTTEQVLKLIEECKLSQKSFESKYGKILDKTINLLFFVPITALITCIIKSEKNINWGIFLSATLAGIIIICILGIFYLVQYYSSGHNKDKYLLNALKELEYCDIDKDSN